MQLVSLVTVHEFPQKHPRHLPRQIRAASPAGRNLAHWHLNYETVACHPGVAVEEMLAAASSQAPTVIDRRYRVTKMKFGKTKDASGQNAGRCLWFGHVVRPNGR